MSDSSLQAANPLGRAAAFAAVAPRAEGKVGDFVALLKPRVMSLVVFTGLAGLLVAPGSIHPLLAAVAILCIAVNAGAAGAINMWYDRDIDAVMQRTRARPIPAGRVEPAEALAFGVILSLLSVMVMGLAVNWAAACLLALANGFYVFVYTIWLKRRTPQNIVIGGAAGAFPPMIGWAAVTGGVSLESIALFLIIFFWTPPHFWALSLFRRADYAAVGIPMLSVVAGRREVERQIQVYTGLLVALSLLPFLLGTTGLLYGGMAVILGGIFLALGRGLRGDKGDRVARQMFGYSILYLFMIFALIIIDRDPGLLVMLVG